MFDEPSPSKSPPPPGWNLARPLKLSKPSFWPATLALGATLILGGLITSLIITGVGLAMFAVALGGWIGNIRDERKQ
jgi:hypothetical protein